MIIEKLIYFKIKSQFSPIMLEIRNESYKHKKHIGYSKNSHIYIRMVSNDFLGKSSIEKHKIMYNLLYPLSYYYIHSLRLDLLGTEKI